MLNLKVMFMKKRKGISPLIASVLLIAFTMAIAGIMATWATTFTRQKMDISSQDAECIGAIDLGAVEFSNTTLSVKIKNVGLINLTGLKAYTEYSNKANSKQYTMKDYNFSDPFIPGSLAWLVVDTGDTAQPLKVTVMAQNCPKNEAIIELR
jgi:flagellin-like protein